MITISKLKLFPVRLNGSFSIFIQFSSPSSHSSAYSILLELVLEMVELVDREFRIELASFSLRNSMILRAGLSKTICFRIVDLYSLSFLIFSL